LCELPASCCVSALIGKSGNRHIKHAKYRRILTLEMNKLFGHIDMMLVH
jgi:hypothetical protein